MTTAPSAPPTAGAIVAGKYRLESTLAHGGMGSLWLARHTGLDLRVVVKFMDPSFAASPAGRARFEREAKAAASLHNPHVVHVQDYGVERDLPYLVMELLEGEDLAAKLRRERRLSLPATARLVAQIAKGLRRAHEAGIVHRDLKPANVFLARVDGEEVVKILDFGIAKETGIRLVGEATRTGEVVGSPHYMSPEQIRSEKDLDPRSDVWAVGVVAFRAITGKLPFPGGQIGAVIGQILADPVPEASRIAPDLPAVVDRFFERALARDRAARFASMRELSDELNALVEVVRDATAVGLGAPPPSALASELTTNLGTIWIQGRIDADAVETPRGAPIPSTEPVDSPTETAVHAAPKRGIAWLGIGAALVTATAIATVLFVRPKAAAPAPRVAPSAVETAATSLAPSPIERPDPPSAASAPEIVVPAATAARSAVPVPSSQQAASKPKTPPAATDKPPSWGF